MWQLDSCSCVVTGLIFFSLQVSLIPGVQVFPQAACRLLSSGCLLGNCTGPTELKTHLLWTCSVLSVLVLVSFPPPRYPEWLSAPPLPRPEAGHLCARTSLPSFPLFCAFILRLESLTHLCHRGHFVFKPLLMSLGFLLLS